MRNYTQIKDRGLRALANRKIEKEISYIGQRVKDLLGRNLHSLLLCGSFGRGEGAVTIDKKDGDHLVRIVNDYDFTVVLASENPFAYALLYKKIHRPLEALAKALAEELGIKQVDLSPKPLSYFKGMPMINRAPGLKIENYEVKKGHVMVWPPEDKNSSNPTRHMPPWKPWDIPLFEGTWLFRNRGTGLVLAALYFDRNMDVALKNQENFMIECNKALLAAGDSLLLLKGRYHHLYSRRLEIIRSLDLNDIPHGDSVRNAYIRALSFKLEPDFNRVEHQDLSQYWADTLDLFSKSWQFFEHFRLKKDFRTWEAYSDLNRPENKINFKTWAARILREKSLSLETIGNALKRSCPGFSVSLTALVLFSAIKDGRSAGMMEKAAEKLGMDLTGDHRRDWISLARELLKEVHPGGEAGRVLKRGLPGTGAVPGPA